MSGPARRSAWWSLFGALTAWAVYAAPCHLIATGTPDRLGLGWLAVQLRRALDLPGRALLQLLRPDSEPFAQPAWLAALCVLAVLAAAGALTGLVLSRLVRDRVSSGGVPSGAAALALSLVGVLVCGYALGPAGAWLGRQARLAAAPRADRQALAAEILGFAAGFVWALLLALPPPQAKYWSIGM
jgi:hypothetical protein